MDPAHRAVLRRLRLELSGQLLVSDTIVPLLFQEEVLTEAQVEDIESRTSERRKTLYLLDLLPNRGPRAFPVLLQALDDFSWVRDRLLQELRAETGSRDPTGSGPEATASHLDRDRLLLDPDRLLLDLDPELQRVPSDRELSRLAARLGSEWEAVLVGLGLSVEDVFRCRSDHSLSSQAAALAGLIRWRRAEGRRATMRRLQEGLREAQVHPSVLEEVLRRPPCFSHEEA